jgi:rhomboid family GlyGly-CTERM serine protease
MSDAERCALAGALVLVLLHVLVTWWPPLGQALEYRRALLAAQPWRVLSGHLVHLSWPHVSINAAAWFIVARLFAPELPPRSQLFVALAAGFAISTGLGVLYPDVDWYRGFSGVLHAVYFAGATAWLVNTLRQPRLRTARRLVLPAALVAGGWVKVLVEHQAGGGLPYAEWLGAATVPQAHLLGAACGSLFGALLARARPSDAAAPPRQHGE